MTPVAWALLAFVILATLGALLARGRRSASGAGSVGAPQEARPAVVPPAAEGACRRCGQPLGPREGVACLECRAPHHAACMEQHQGCAACGAWPAVW